MAIRALGSASGLDLESLVTQLVRAERMTKESRLDDAKKSLDSSLSGYGKLKSAMSRFQDAVKALSLDMGAELQHSSEGSLLLMFPNKI